MTCARGCCPSPAEHFKSLRFFSIGNGPMHEKDRQLGRDRDAYKRLRENGVQPRTVDGSAKIEATASTAAQVEGRPA